MFAYVDRKYNEHNTCTQPHASQETNFPQKLESVKN